MKATVQQISVDLVGSTGRILANDQGASLITQTERELSTTPIVPQGTVGGMQAALMNLLAAMEKEQELESPPREARKTVALIEGILASQAAGNCRVQLG